MEQTLYLIPHLSKNQIIEFMDKEFIDNGFKETFEIYGSYTQFPKWMKDDLELNYGEAIDISGLVTLTRVRVHQSLKDHDAPIITPILAEIIELSKKLDGLYIYGPLRLNNKLMHGNKVKSASFKKDCSFTLLVIEELKDSEAGQKLLDSIDSAVKVTMNIIYNRYKEKRRKITVGEIDHFTKLFQKP